jgi:hypothetical protein
VRKIKTLSDPCPHFTRQAANHNHLLEIHSDTQKFKRGERFIRYRPDRQLWCVYTYSDSPQVCGRYNSVITAVFNALK